MNNIQCPNCGSYKTVSKKQHTIGLFMTAGTMLGCVGFIFFPLLFVAAIAYVFGILAIFGKNRGHVCLECQFNFDGKQI